MCAHSRRLISCGSVYGSFVLMLNCSSFLGCNIADNVQLFHVVAAKQSLVAPVTEIYPKVSIFEMSGGRLQHMCAQAKTNMDDFPDGLTLAF